MSPRPLAPLEDASRDQMRRGDRLARHAALAFAVGEEDVCPLATALMDLADRVAGWCPPVARVDP